MLHTVSRSLLEFDHHTFTALLTQNDVVVLWQDGVICAIDGNHALTPLIDSAAIIYALDADLHARGLTHLVSKKVHIVTHAELVELTVKHFPQMAW